MYYFYNIFQTRLAHEIGAGSPCIKCTLNCPGLDLHFWRKTCKNCKCSRDDHDVPNDEFPQFDLLFGKSKIQSNKKKMIVLKVNEVENHNGQTFDWIPPDTTIELAADYMKALPNDKLPIKGSAGAALRKQQLQKQLPLHDIDHKACDGLSESECTQFTRYLNNIKKYAGQGKVTKFITAKPFDKDQIRNTNSECPRSKNEEPTNHHNINLRTPGSFVPKIFPTLSHGIQSNEFMGLDQDGNVFTRYPSAESRIENKSLEEKSNIVHGREYSAVKQDSEQYLQHPYSFDNMKNNYDIANSTRVPGYQGNSYNLRELRPSYSGQSQAPVNAERQVLKLKNPGDCLAQFEDVNKTPNSSLHFAQTNTYNDNSKNDLVSSESLPYAHQFQMTGGNYPQKSVIHSESLNKPLNSIGPLDKFYQNTLSNQQHIIANSKNNYDLVHSSNVLGSQQQHSINSQDNEQNLQHSQLPEHMDNQILRSKNPVDYLIHSQSINNPLNSALNLPQTNLLSDNSNDGSISSTNLPYSHQFQRTGGINLGQSFVNQVSPHHPLMSNTLEKPINNHDSSLQNYNYEENAMLADKILSDALLPPSSINSGAIIGSTLDQKGLNEIREKLTSKYSDESTESNGSLSVKNFGFSDKKLTDSNSKSADAHLSSYGGVRPHLIHSQEQNISVFPKECIGSLQTINNSASDYLCDTMNNLSVIQKKAQNCHQCQQDIHIGDVVVTAEKAENAVWHPGCFVCSTCNELLADLVYFYYKEKLYCGRDLAGLLEIPRCFACDEVSL